MGFKVESAPPKKHDVLVTRLKDIPEWLCFYHLFQDKRAAEFTPPLLFHKSSRKVGSNFRIGIVFGSSFNWPQKRWPLNNFIEVIKTFKKACHEIILFGTLDEAKDAQYIIDKCFASIINTTGMLTFSDLKSEVSHCDIILGNDTGTMHLAAALGIPTITLFGPTNPAKWNPLTSTAVTSQENCSPCYYLSSMPNCPHINCMKNILPERVAQILKEKLALLESCQGNQFNTN
jgi:ADP-heptose:LPS heptosyltransferase